MTRKGDAGNVVAARKVGSAPVCLRLQGGAHGHRVVGIVHVRGLYVLRIPRSAAALRKSMVGIKLDFRDFRRPRMLMVIGVV